MAGTVLLVVMSGFNDMSFLASQVVLEEAGHDVITASQSSDAIKGQESSVMTVALHEALKQDITYNLLAIIGGQGIENWDLLIQTIQQFHKESKLIAAIGDGVKALEKAGLSLDFSSDDQIKDQNNIITLYNPENSESFAEYLVTKL